MRLFISALFALLLCCLASTSNIIGVTPTLELTEGYIKAQTDGGFGLSTNGNQSFKCSALQPCVDGACCNTDGFCGYRPEHCHPKSPARCVANCDAKAPCGEFSEGGAKTCPLNLCCSHFGFCGTSDIFCRSETQSGASTRCQGDCDKKPPVTCDTPTVKRHIGYFEASNIRRRACEQIWPGRLNTTGFTHIVLGFAVFDPKTFAVGMQRPDDVEIYRQFLRLSADVQKGLAIGGWNISNEGPTRTAWSDMTSTMSNRKMFIDSLKQFLDIWKFAGIEIHWEWPGTSDRGGNPADTQNQVDLIHELRESFGKDFGISVVLPAQYEYLKNMAPSKMQDAVDWFTVLTYDLHGPWDAFVAGLGPKIKPHTDLAEVNSTLNLLSSANLEPAKINMGIANYGRGFTVANQTCKYYGCEFTGPSKAGICTKEEGILSACEIRRIIRNKNLTPQVIYGGAGVKEISWDDQWIGYDDDETLGMKLALANKRCLGGTSLWALEHNHCDKNVGAPAVPPPSAQPGLPPSAPPESVHPAPSIPPVSATSVQSSTVPQPPYSSTGQVPSSVTPTESGHPVTSNAPISTTSIQGSAASSSVVWSSQPTSTTDSSRINIPSSVQGSPPSLSPPNPQPSSQPGPSSISWSETASPAPASSVVPSSGPWNSQPSSVAASSGTLSSVLVPSIGMSLSTSPGLSTTPSSGPSNWPVPSSMTPPSSIGSFPIATSVVSTPAPNSSSSGSPAASSSASWSSFWSNTASGSVPFSSLTSPSVAPPSGSSVSSSSILGVPIATSSAGPSSIAPPFDSSRSRSISQTPSDAQSSTVVGSSDNSAGFSATAIIPVIPSLASSAAASNTQGSSQGSPSSQGSSPAAGSSWTGFPVSSTQAPSWVPPPFGSSAAQSSLITGSSLALPSFPIVSGSIQSSSGETASHQSASIQSSGFPSGSIFSSSKASTAPPEVTIIPTPISGTTLPGVIFSTTSSSTIPLPTIVGCPMECRNQDWCKIFCQGWIFPRPVDVQPPYECLLPANINWCRAWWWGPPGNNQHNDGDPDSHSDSDADCKPNDCVAECVAWRVVTFFMFKRPICPCVPKKCDRDGESDSPSDSDHDDPKVKPKPTSRPKEKNPKCKLFGCGCGWMGLGFGPGCPGLEFEINVPCGLFGCNPCVFFGCSGTQPAGIVGYDGYCLGGGCEPCPPELCSRPGCTISGGCGPKPGPAPTKPPNRPDPENCDNNKRTIVTEHFIWCTEGFNVSALPSSLQQTSSTMVSSMCLPMIDATITVCGGAIPGFDTTTTLTGTKTLTSDGSACTRAPLSLDDDEGDNTPDDPLHTSSTFASNTTSMVSTRTSSSSSSPTKTSFAPPYPSLGLMDKNGHWKVKISQYMFNDYSEVGWDLYDPNGNHAGERNVHDNGMKEMKGYIESVNRPFQHMMPFGVDMTVSDPLDVNKCRVTFEIKKGMPDCNRSDNTECKPIMTTESFTEDKPFHLSICNEACNERGKKTLLAWSDLWCQDLNDADWEQMANGWKRNFECGWKGF